MVNIVEMAANDSIPRDAKMYSRLTVKRWMVGWWFIEKETYQSAPRSIERKSGMKKKRFEWI